MYEQLKLQNQLCFRLYTASRLVTGIYYPYLAPLGLTYAQYLVMMVLWEEDGQTSGSIASKLLLDFNTITPLLQRMENQGLISRKKGKSDSRQRIVFLTEKGKNLQEQAKNVPDCLVKELSSQMGDISCLFTMIPQLDRFIEALRNKDLPDD